VRAAPAQVARRKQIGLQFLESLICCGQFRLEFRIVFQGSSGCFFGFGHAFLSLGAIFECSHRGVGLRHGIEVCARCSDALAKSFQPWSS